MLHIELSGLFARLNSEIINTLCVCEQVIFFREIYTPPFLKWGQFLSSAELRAIAVFSLPNLLFAQLLCQFPSWASSREKQQKRQNWRRDGAKVDVRHLPVSCLLSRAAVFPHKKPEQLITCSAAHVAHSSCSHVPSPCSPQPDARSCIPAGDAARATPVTPGEILWDSLSHPARPRAGLPACPWAPDTSQSHLLLLHWQKWEKFCLLCYFGRGGDVWLAGSCWWFFSPILYPAK